MVAFQRRCLGEEARVLHWNRPHPERPSWTQGRRPAGPSPIRL